MSNLPRNLDLSLLRTFACVARHASMTVAGDILCLTQGAVSHQVKRLEQALGGELFERGQRGLRLTLFGERLLGHASGLLQLNDAILADMTPAAALGAVRLGVPYDLVDTCLAPVLKRYGEAHPLVDISLLCASSLELLEALAGGRIDLALVEQALEDASGERLRVEQLVWVGARAGRAHLRHPLPVSLVADSCAFKPAVLAALDAQGRAWRTVFENCNIDATRATVRSDLAVSVWLASTVPADLHVLSGAKGLPDLPSLAIHLHLPGQAVARAVSEFARYLRGGLGCLRGEC